ncbi:uncharacterized protein LOC110249840 isoform X2 [Exaiptasia diaphana]|uniref:Delta-like protein n=1 Tax=Exaiptasia diaphana TaxID=2652724 RepID=A0A913YRV2_EXADI|nr:uncharacterized protein LOC110249840 isoform X2 [Exaiptasia diaphana]
MMYSTLLVSAMIFNLLVTTSGTHGVFEVKFIKFENPTGRDFNGGYCDTFNDCDTYLQICIGSPRPPMSSTCTANFKQYEAPSNTNSFDINTEPYSFQFSKLQKDFGTYVEAWDDDTKPNKDDKIDTFWFDFQNQPSANGSIPNWTTKSQKGRRTKSTKCTLYYKFRIYCSTHYYGKTCDKYCKYTDSFRNGHYSCDSTGEKICHPNWYGQNCTVYCKPTDGLDGHYSCSIEGTKVCHPYWYGQNCTVYCKPTDGWDGHYNCSLEGSKVCHPNWYGQNCTVYCKPTDGLDGHYNCSLEGSKVCHPNWYVQNCTVYCKSTDGLIGHYNCSLEGSKVCHPNWYGDKCSRFCKPRNDSFGHYVCNTTTGHKICRAGWYDANCTLMSFIPSSSAISTLISSSHSVLSDSTKNMASIPKSLVFSSSYSSTSRDITMTTMLPFSSSIHSSLSTRCDTSSVGRLYSSSPWLISTLSHSTNTKYISTTGNVLHSSVKIASMTLSPSIVLNSSISSKKSISRPFTSISTKSISLPFTSISSQIISLPSTSISSKSTSLPFTSISSKSTSLPSTIFPSKSTSLPSTSIPSNSTSPPDVNVPSWSQKAKKWLVKTWKKPIGKIAVALIILCLIILVIVLVRRKRRKRPSPQKAVDGTNGFSNIDMPACLLLDAAYVGEMEEIEPAKKNRTQSHGPMPEPIFGASNPFFDDKTKFLHLDNYDVSNRVEREKTRSSSKSETKTRSISNPFYADESKYVKLNDNNESNL